MSEEKAIETLRKLYKLKEGAEKIGSLAEAEAASARIQVILLKYNLSLSTTDLEKEDHGLGNIKVDCDDRKVEGKWISLLYAVLARNNFCRTINTIRSDHRVSYITILGRKHNIEVVEYFGGYLVPTIRNLALKSFKEYQGMEKRNTYIRGFLLGAVQGINNKLSSERKAQSDENINVTALVKVEDGAVQKYMEDLFPRLKKGKPTSSSSMQGYLNGFNTGKGMGLYKPIEGKNKVSGILK